MDKTLRELIDLGAELGAHQQSLVDIQNKVPQENVVRIYFRVL